MMDTDGPVRLGTLHSSPPKRDAGERVMGVGMRPAEAGRRVRPIACRMEDQKDTRY
jgi:hypothetical protein